MAETAKLRIKLKHDTEENWLKATTFKPLKGELIIYDVDSTHSAPRFKVGDGVKVVGDLPFADKDLAKLGDINADFLSNLLVAGDGISINKKANADKIEVKIDSSKVITATGFHAKEGTAESYLYADNLQYWDYQGNQYMLAFPSKNGTLTTDNSFKTINGNSIVGSGDIAVVTLAADNTFTGTNSFTDLLNVVSSDFDPDNKMGDKLVLHSNKLTYWDGDYAIDYNFPYVMSGNSTTLAGCQAPNTFTATNEFQNSTNFFGRAYFSGSVDFDGEAPTSRFGLATDQLLSRDSSKTYQMPSKSGTLALTSDIPSFNNFTLLTSKPSDWATNYDTYYKKGDFGFFRNLSDSTWAANKFYSAVPAEIDIQTLTQPIKIQVSGTPGWGVYGGLNLSYGKAKLYGIDNSFEDNVGYIDISNGNLTSAVYNADFTLSHPAGRGYGFSVKDTSTLFSVGLNKSQAGDYAEQYYCNINAPLNVTQIHGFTQLTDQPSDWSTKYSSYYAGFDAFNGNSRFWGRSDELYKSTNDILLNVGTGHKIKIAGLYGSLGTDEIRNSITLSNSGINLKHEITGATSTLDILPSNININSGALKLSASNDAGYIELGAVGNINLKGNYPITITSDADKVYGSNMFKLTVSGQNAIGVDTFSTSSNNLIRFEMTPKFNTNKIRGMAGVDLSLPASAGLLAHIPTGTSQNAMMFGDGAWKEPIKINGETFKSKAGSTIYAPTSKPTGTGIKYIAFDNSNNPNFFKAHELALSGIILTSSLSQNKIFDTIDLYKMSSVTFVAVKPDGGCSATTLNNSAIKGFSDTGYSIAITNDSLRMYFTIDVSNTSSTKIKTGVGNYGTSGNVFKSFIIYPQY